MPGTYPSLSFLCAPFGAEIGREGYGDRAEPATRIGAPTGLWRGEDRRVPKDLISKNGCSSW
jgi:hypothetical protein